MIRRGRCLKEVDKFRIVAGRIGLSVSWLSQVERGVRSATMVELAEVLKATRATWGAPDEPGSERRRAVSGAA